MTTTKGRFSPRILIFSFAATALARSHFVSAFSLPVSPNISRRFLARTYSARSPKPNTLNRSPSSSSSSSSPTKLSGLFDDKLEEDQADELEFDYLTTPFASLPSSLQNEIYAAESQTPSSQNRLQRILLYVALAVFGASIAFFNAFLENLRYGEGSPSSDLAAYGFEWVEGNGIWDFLFLTKVGGALGLLGAGLAGTLAEVEFRSKKENAEKIWAEMQRRRSLKEKRSASSSASGTTSSKKKKRRSKEMTGKQKKRISALTELMTMEEEATKSSENADVEVTSKAEDVDDSNKGQLNANTNTKTDTTGDEANKSPGGGIFDSIKNFYEKADSMAASQALLLNKELEDRGIVEKITDETGLKVIGKEAAKELKRSSRGNDGDGDGGSSVSGGEKARNKE